MVKKKSVHAEILLACLNKFVEYLNWFVEYLNEFVKYLNRFVEYLNVIFETIHNHKLHALSAAQCFNLSIMFRQVDNNLTFVCCYKILLEIFIQVRRLVAIRLPSISLSKSNLIFKTRTTRSTFKTKPPTIRVW